MAEFHQRGLKIVSIAEIVTLILAFITGLVITISLSLVESRTGFCPLYAAHGTSCEDHFLKSTAPGSCSFAIKIQIFACIKAFIYAATRIAILVTNKVFTTRLRLIRFISVPLHGIAAFLILVQACIVTVGRSSLCKSWLECHPGRSCSDIWIVGRPESKDFTDTLYTAEAASWISFFVWVTMVILGITYLVFEHKNKESDQMAIVNEGEHDIKT